MLYDAFIVAGGRAPWLQQIAGTECRAIARLGERRMLDYTISALQESGKIRRIIVAVDEEFLPQLAQALPPGVEAIAAADTLSTTAARLAQLLGQDNRLLLGVCDDIPLLTADAVLNFLRQCENSPGAELYYPIIRKEVCLQTFPSAKRTYAKLADGTFTGGNMMLMDKDLILTAQERAKELFIRRKSPLKLCAFLGWRFIIKLLLHTLNIQGLENRLSQLFSTRCKAIITPYAAVGMDIDKPSDWQLAQELLRKEHAYGQSQKN